MCVRYISRTNVPRPPSSAAAASSPAASPSSSFLGFFFFFFIRPRSRPSSATSGGGVATSAGAVAEAILAEARASESGLVDGLWDCCGGGDVLASEPSRASLGVSEKTHHGSVLLFVGSRHDFDAAVGGHDKLLVGESNGLARFRRLLGLGLLRGLFSTITSSKSISRSGGLFAQSEQMWR